MISTKGRYALRVMIDIAEQKKDEYVPLKDIAKRQMVSKKYLELIVKNLVDAGLLKGVSGKNGGYKLTKNPSKYSVWEILKPTEGTMSPVRCVDGENCIRKSNCKTFPMWAELDGVIKKFLSGKKLSDFI